ncbi:MAG: hypothetical protein ACRDY2_06450 [Acidimicrobiales bacterium]
MPTWAGGSASPHQLPALDIDLLDAPHHILRMLFESFRLEVRYHKPDHHALARATIADDTIDHLDTNVIPLLAERVTNGKRCPSPRATVSHLRAAPGRSWGSPPTHRTAEPVAPPGLIVGSCGRRAAAATFGDR